MRGVKSVAIKSSSSKEGHMQQVSPNRHPATVSKTIKNIVKGVDPSPGKARHERQMKPDRQPATLSIRIKIGFGT